MVEDNAQAIGARYKSTRTGSLGTAAGISFYPTKNLGAYGDGGMMITNSEKLAAHARRLRDHGQSGKYLSAEPGWNSRLDEIQAAVLRIKLQRLDDWTAARRAHAHRYNELLAGVIGITTPEAPAHSEHVYHLYTLRIHGESGRRDRVQQKLASLGISTGAYYPTPLHLQPIFAHYRHKAGIIPGIRASLRASPVFAAISRAYGASDRTRGGLPYENTEGNGLSSGGSAGTANQKNNHSGKHQQAREQQYQNANINDFCACELEAEASM